MKTSNFDNLEIMADSIGCYIIKGMVYGGIILFLIGVSMLLYGLLLKKRTLKSVLVRFGCTSGAGIFICLSALLVNYVAHYENSFASFKRTVPIGYIIAIIIWCGYLFLRKNEEKNKDEDNDEG